MRLFFLYFFFRNNWFPDLTFLCPKMASRQRPCRSVHASPASFVPNFPGMSSSSERFDYLFKVVLVGDTGVGKSSLLNRFADDTFTERMTATIGVDFKIRTVEIGGKRVKLQIWDSAGQERFRALTASYYRGAHAVAIVFDLTCIDSLDAVQNVWLDEIDRHCPSSACRVVIGNKNDLIKNREISHDQVSHAMNTSGCLYLETSAKTADNVQNAFESVVRQILERFVRSRFAWLFFRLTVGILRCAVHVVLTRLFFSFPMCFLPCRLQLSSRAKRRFCATASGRTACVRRP